MKEMPMSDESKTNAVSQPCLILAHSDPVYEAALARGFRRLGWDVYRVKSGPEVRRLAPMLDANLVILDAELPEESGWLTCDKLTREQSHVEVILVTGEAGPLNHAMAAFVGASSLVHRSEGPARVVEEVCRPAVPAAG
jgi:DNA-binding response OmpR family regulator